VRGKLFRSSNPPLYELHRARIEALYDRPLNFDPEGRINYTAEHGWRVDDFQVELPPEAPGSPVPGGSWEVARRLLRDYRFADPSIITGIFLPDAPLEQRVMLLRGRAYGMTFWLGARVGEVIDEQSYAADGERRIWGFTYRTLEGHLERGEMAFTVIKQLRTGQVAFRINAFSRAAEIANPIIRLGFRLFGRRLQLRFINNSLARMQQLVVADLESVRSQERPEPGPPVVHTDEVAPQVAEDVETMLDTEPHK
jgi:uncharacterized protein (UPF0548 family)